MLEWPNHSWTLAMSALLSKALCRRRMRASTRINYIRPYPQLRFNIIDNARVWARSSN
jgi:hypothetical protein